MKTLQPLLYLLLTLAEVPSLLAQPDGDHPTTNGFGWTFLAPDANVGGGTVLPYNMTIGNTPSDFATLRVRGDQLPVNDQWETGWLCTFRTDVPAGFNQNWSMVRGNNEMGRLWHTNPGEAFNIGSRRPNGNLWLRNAAGDGFRLNFNGVVATLLNTYTLNRQAFAALGNADAINGQSGGLMPNGPWARFHLVHPAQGSTAPNFGYRPWMRNGTMGTGNSDLFYVGHKYEMVGATGGEIDDRSDLVAAWGDDVLPAGSAHSHDNFSFRFVGTLGQGGSAGTVEGLELMRLRPFRANAEDAIEGFVGIGDWVNAGGPLPDERLDVLDRTIRIRELIPDYEDITLDAVVVSDANGRLHWRDASTLSGQDCDWVITPDDHVVTAHLATTPDNCPDVSNNVGIGVPVPEAKLTVFKGVATSTIVETGVRVDMGTQAGLVVAVDAYAETGGNNGNFGVQGTANNGSRNYGVRGISGSTGSLNVGVYGEVATSSECSNTNFAIWGHAPNISPICVSHWAGWFDGNVNVSGFTTLSGGYWSPSDEGLKTDLNEISDGAALIAQLSPWEYQFVPEVVPQLSLPEGQQAGLKAQELEQVLPHLVRPMNVPAQYDPDGVELHPAAEISTINYTGLIPYLIAAIKEQQTRLDQMQETLEVCCSGQPDGDRAAGPVVLVRGASERLLDIIPNPVGDMARINFTLERGGHVRILLTGGEGKAVQVLHEATMQDGAHGIDWYTAQLAAGMYYITLLLDGEPLVKRAVKL